MQDDLFDQFAAHAGKGLRKLPPAPAHPPWMVRCPNCGNLTDVDQLNATGYCLSCSWTGAGQARTPWKAKPGDAAMLGSYKPPFVPFNHQLSALAGLRGSVRALLMDMGTGKTKVIIDDWALRVLAGEVDTLVVIAPRGVYRNWEGVRANGSAGELGVHLAPELLDRAAVVAWRSGSATAKHRVAWLLGLTDRKRLRVLLVNVEALSTVRAAVDAVAALLSQRHGRAILVVDESTRIRTWDSSRTKAAQSLGTLVPGELKRIATGLVTPRNPLDLFSQFEFLDWRILGYRSWFGFKARYAIEKERPSSSRPGKKERFVVAFRNLSELRDKIADHSFRVTKDECLDLPPKLYTMHYVDLTPEQTRVYADLKNKAYAQLTGGSYVYATEVLPRLIRLQQVLCGFVVDEEGTEREVSSNRLDDLVELLGDHNGKAIIWAPYRRSLAGIVARLRREFGERSTVRFWGDVRDEERLEGIHRFQTDAECRFFVGNAATGGLGITLTAASLVVYYANSPDLEQRLQSEDRAHRAGLKHAVTYVDMCAPDTIDEKWIATLRRKMDLADALVGDQPRAWLV